MGQNQRWHRDPPPTAFEAVDDVLFFAADDGQHGRELWTSNGTESGTAMVADLMPGSMSGLTSTQGNTIGAYAGAAYFSVWDGNTGSLCLSDGSSAGTAIVAPLAPETGATDFANADDLLYFVGTLYGSNERALSCG